MKPLGLKAYFMGRDDTFASELTPAIRANALLTVERINRLLDQFAAAVPGAAQRTWTSGWRPAAVNGKVKGAAKASKHMTAQAGDVSDDDGALDKWLDSAAGKRAMEDCALWREHPSATPRWCHLQTVPPASGNRTFFP